MAIQTAVQLHGVTIADCYVRLTDIAGKKAREDLGQTDTGEVDAEGEPIMEDNPPYHYVTYGVRVETSEGEVVNLRALDRFKIENIDPSGDIPALCYADLKARVVALGYEESVNDIEDV